MEVRSYYASKDAFARAGEGCSGRRLPASDRYGVRGAMTGCGREQPDR